MAPTKPLIRIFTLAILLLTTETTSQNDDDLLSDIAYLESQEAIAASTKSQTNPAHQEHVTNHNNNHPEDELETPERLSIDEKNVVVLKEKNFTEFVESNKHVLVEFYAPWCGHCQALAPEYAAAATELKDEGVVLAKVDGTEEKGLLQTFNIPGFPTLLFFVDGVHASYEGERTKDAIVTWVKKKIGPALFNITTAEEAQAILASESKLVLGFLDSLQGSESEKLAAAARSEEDVTFYQTTSPEIAKLFHIESNVVNRPALVLLKKEVDEVTHFDGEFSKLAITKFVSSNKFPLVATLNEGNAGLVLQNPIQNKVLLFGNSKESEKILSILQELAKVYKRKIIFAFVDTDDKEFGGAIGQYFGLTEESPMILGLTGFEDGKKYLFDGELSLSNLKSFAEDFLADKLTPFYKSDPIPEMNDGDVKVVVGNNFNEIVSNESKDVLLEIYAPWCGHCQALEPTYSRLGRYLKGIDSLVIAKMDGSANEHPGAKFIGFPTLLFYPAGKKSSVPIEVNTERTVVEFYKFIKKHASIPFKLQRPDATEVVQDSNASANEEEISVKDEL